MMRFLFSLMLYMLCAQSLSAATLPDTIHADYDVYKSGMKVGKIVESYSRIRDRYTLTSTTTPVGLLAVFRPEKIFIRSSGLINQQGLRPLQFSHQRERDGNKESRAEFNWDEKQLTLIQHQQRTTVDLAEGTQDRLSAMYQFMFLNFKKTQEVNFAMTNGSKLDDYHYAVTRNQKLSTPAGEFTTLYLDSQAKAGESRTEIWLANERNNLPCKMIVTDAKGEQLTQILSKIELRP